jgi:hypothetical protein
MRIHQVKLSGLAACLQVSLLSGCAVVAVADAAVSVCATLVKAGASVVGAAVDVTVAGVKAITRPDDTEK